MGWPNGLKHWPQADSSGLTGIKKGPFGPFSMIHRCHWKPVDHNWSGKRDSHLASDPLKNKGFFLAEAEKDLVLDLFLGSIRGKKGDSGLCHFLLSIANRTGSVRSGQLGDSLRDDDDASVREGRQAHLVTSEHAPTESMMPFQHQRPPRHVDCLCPKFSEI